MVGPHCLRLIDTAGLNPEPGEVERLGIEKTIERLREADLVLLVLDATHPAPALPAEVSAELNSTTTLVVLNKGDLLGQKSPETIGPDGFDSIQISALTHDGMTELDQRIIALADNFSPSDSSDQIAVNARHAEALRHATQALESAGQHLANRGPTELLAADLRGTLDAFGEIGGRIENEAMLDRLFETFCIGK